MRKIMFNDRYGLTTAVIDGRKTMTRRLVHEKILAGANDYVQNVHGTGHDFLDFLLDHSLFKVGDLVAIAQPLKDMGFNPHDRSNGHIWGLEHCVAWTNKMFVTAGQCCHQIMISDIKVERLQDITEEDILKEGIRFREGINNLTFGLSRHYYFRDLLKKRAIDYGYARWAFADLIDRVSGKGTWDRNPWVFVYSFKLFK